MKRLRVLFSPHIQSTILNGYGKNQGFRSRSRSSCNFHTTTASRSIMSMLETTTTSGNDIVSERELEEQADINLAGRDFLSLKHFKKVDLYQFLWTAKDLKFRCKKNKELFRPLTGINAVGIFHPGSTESRLSFELGLSRLGGHMTILKPEEVNVVTGSDMKDAAKLLSGMCDLIVVGGYSQELVVQLAAESSTPVISAFSTHQHPVQTLAQFLTMLEFFGYLRGVNVCWVGNGNKVANSLLYGCSKLGIDCRMATPSGFEADPDVMIDTVNISRQSGADFLIGNDPLQAVYRADAILSGPWDTSGDNEGSKALTKDFSGFQINRKMLTEAGGDWVFMHSLPRQPCEVTDDIFYGEESMVHTEIENRMWVAMAVMLNLNQAYVPKTSMPKFVRG